MDQEEQQKLRTKCEGLKFCRWCRSPEKLESATDIGRHFIREHVTNKSRKVFACPLCNVAIFKVKRHVKNCHPGKCIFCLQPDPPSKDHLACCFLVQSGEAVLLREKVTRVLPLSD